MGKRIEMDLSEKEKLIQECLAGRMRMREAARRAGVGHSTMHTWISRYRAEGVSALSENGNAQRRRYSEDIRQKAVEEYLSGQGSAMAIAEKHKLRSENLVLDWAEDRRGKRLANQIPRTPEEALRIENARLERENYSKSS